nr:hypothetical protein [Aureimonas sp. AU4]
MNAALPVLCVTVMLDVVGQLLFKRGLDGSHEAIEDSLMCRVLGSPAILCGVLVYGAEFTAWLFVLSRLDLSEAFPIATLSYVGVVLASRFLLGEMIPPRRWIATVMIAAGAALVGANA